MENTIGLVRRHLPKKTDLAKVSVKELKDIERWLNNRPRKCLGFKTTAEVFRRSVALTQCIQPIHFSSQCVTYDAHFTELIWSSV